MLLSHALKPSFSYYWQLFHLLYLYHSANPHLYILGLSFNKNLIWTFVILFPWIRFINIISSTFCLVPISPSQMLALYKGPAQSTLVLEGSSYTVPTNRIYSKIFRLVNNTSISHSLPKGCFPSYHLPISSWLLLFFNLLNVCLPLSRLTTQDFILNHVLCATY